MRLDQFLVQADICSRSEAKKIIKMGRVCVGGKVLRHSSVHIDEDTDEVSLDGITIEYSKFHYYMLNKPGGCVSATKDRLSDTVIDFLKGEVVKDCFPVGRLDKDTEGLLIICDDGKLAHRLLSPKHHVDKVYEVTSNAKLSELHFDMIRKGMDIGDDKPTLPAEIEYIGTEGNDAFKYRITICEGRFHQIKRMFLKCDAEVIFLKRVSMGPIILDENLGLGSYRKLTSNEIAALQSYGK